MLKIQKRQFIIYLMVDQEDLDGGGGEFFWVWGSVHDFAREGEREREREREK